MEEILEKLDKTFENVTDITDSASMDLVLAILDDSRAADDDYMQLLVDRLEEEEICWKQPKYQTNFGLTQKPPPEEAELCATGHFTKKEGELVKKNWEIFVRTYNVPDTPICLARWRNRTKSRHPDKSAEERVRHFVAAFLAQGLHRNLYQIYKYFKNTYAYPVKLRKYTPTEEKIMKICFYHRPKDACVIVSEVLGRERRGIVKRYSQYANGKPEPRPRLKWSLELAAKLIHLLMKYADCSFKKLKYNQFSPEVWHKVGEEMGQLPVYLREFWLSKLHVQLFAKCTIRLKSLRKIIFKKLIDSPYEIWGDISWKKLVKDFPDGFTDMFLYKVAKTEFRGHPTYRTIVLPALLQQVAENSKKRRNKRLKTLRYHKSDGTLSYTKHDTYVCEVMKNIEFEL